MVQSPDGRVVGWTNRNGLAGDTYRDNVPVANISPDQTATFADLDGDGRADLLRRQPNGQIYALWNHNGLAGDTYQGTGNLIAHISPDETANFG